MDPDILNHKPQILFTFLPILAQIVFCLVGVSVTVVHN